MPEEDDLVEPEGLNAGSTEPAPAGHDSDPAPGEQASATGAAKVFEGQDPGVSGAKTTQGSGQELSAGEG